MGSIMGKVNAYIESPSGQARMKAKIDEYVKNGVKKTAAGDRICTEDDMYMAASKLISVLRSTARSYDLPDSVMRHFDSLACSRPFKMPDGSYEMYIYFEDDLHRESLNPESYDGVRNIVALLNNGYHASDYAYGFWDNHAYTGEWNVLRQGYGDNFAYIRSMKDRQGLHFIQQAVQDFNGNYGSEFNVTAVAGDDYE